MAAGLGVVTPFCSCSAVPAFIGFVAAGVPLGVTLSFLIASPLVNEVAVVLLYGLFGFRIAALYIASGLLIAVLAGFVLGRLRLERWVEPFVFETTLRGRPVQVGDALSWADRTALGRAEVRTILRKIWPYLLVGIALGAVIHGWAPTDFFARYAGSDNPFAPLVRVLLGVPLYSNAAGVLPLVEALHAKGLAMGTLLAFMMSVVALVAAGDDPAAPRAAAPSCWPASSASSPRPSSPPATCSTPCTLTPRTRNGTTAMLVKILGSGCANCAALERATRAALSRARPDRRRREGHRLPDDRRRTAS